MAVSVDLQQIKHKKLCKIKEVVNHDTAKLQSLLQTRDVNELNEKGETALMHAARIGLVEITDFLLAAGANPLITCKDNTAIHFAERAYENEKLFGRGSFCKEPNLSLTRFDIVIDKLNDAITPEEEAAEELSPTSKYEQIFGNSSRNERCQEILIESAEPSRPFKDVPSHFLHRMITDAQGYPDSRDTYVHEYLKAAQAEMRIRMRGLYEPEL